MILFLLLRFLAPCEGYYEADLPIIHVIGEYITDDESRCFIMDQESKSGAQVEAYSDGDRYSICFGTESFKGEIVSEQECYRRFHKAYNYHHSKVVKDFPYLEISRQRILTSLYYNVGSIGPNLIYSINSCNFKLIEKYYSRYVKVQGVENDYLKTRRREELSLWRKTINYELNNFASKTF